MPTSPRRRTLATALAMGRVLLFPVPTDRLGQFELFPEPVPPDPHSSDMLIIRFTELQIRVTRLSSYISREKRDRLFGEYWSVMALIESYELDVARAREMTVEAYHRLIA